MRRDGRHHRAWLGLFVLAVLAASLVIGDGVLAYERSAGTGTGEPLFLHWASFPVVYEINDQTSDALSNIAPGSFPVEAIHRGFQGWVDVRGARVRFDYLGMTPIERTLNDNHNVVSFVDHAYDYNGALAVANYWYYTSTGEMADCDIVFNPAESYDTQGVHEAHFDIHSLTVHEVGHLLGIGHSGLLSTVMYPYMGSEMRKKRMMWPDDRQAVSDAYPSGAWSFERGALSGTVRRNGQPAFGAHVVAINEDHEPVAGRLTQKDGTYRIEGLPPGEYQVVVEPMDRPLSQGNFFSAYWQSQAFEDDFPTLYLGGNSAPDRVLVEAGQTTSGIDFDVSSSVVYANARLIGRGRREGGDSVAFYNRAAELPQGSVGEWRLYVAGEGLGSPATFEVEGPGITRVTGFDYGTLGSGTPYATAGFDVAADAPTGRRILRVESGGEVSLLVGGVEVMPQPAHLMVVKDPLDPDAIYLTWYGGEAPYELVRDTRSDLSTSVPIYSETDLDHSDPVRNDGVTYFYRVDP